MGLHSIRRSGTLVLAVALMLFAGTGSAVLAQDEAGPTYSAWMIESCTLHNYVASALAPNRNVSTGDT